MSSKTILITGGAGFIGANLTRALVAQGHIIHLVLKKSTSTWRIVDLIRSKKVTVHSLDLLDAAGLKQIVSKIKPDVIYHLAAEGAAHSQNDPASIFQTDFIGTLHLLQASADHPYSLFVNVGSSSEYGYCSKPMKESQALQPNSYYAVAKAAQTQLATYTAQHFNKPIVTIRPFSVYGPFESSYKLFPTLLQAAATGKPVQMTDKKAAHDFVFVDDVVNGLLQIETLAQHQGEVINFGSGVQTTLEEAVTTVEKVTGKKLKHTWGEKEDHRWDTHHWVADITKAKKILNWKPAPLATGLTKTWQWYKLNHHLYP